MHKRLQHESIAADLHSVNSMLVSLDEDSDPIGWLQFSYRKAELEKQLSEIDASAPSKSVAMLFGGRPVSGSRGISADFSAAMIGGLQSLVSVHSASIDGFLGERGPVPQRGKSQMLVTDVARGSFGFVLEEADQQNAPASIEAVCSLLADLTTSDSGKFLSATEEVDSRILPSLRAFFKTLDENGATVRILTDEADFSLGRELIERARARIDTMQVSEPYSQKISGRFFTVPDSKKFELFELGGAPVIKGSLSVAFARRLFENDLLEAATFSGKIVTADLLVKDAKLPTGEVRRSYSLIDIKLQLDASAPPNSSSVDHD